MPDPLDPVEALFSGLGSSFVSFGGFLVVSFSGHVLAVQAHEIAAGLSAMLTGGPSAFSLPQWWASIDALELVGSWVGVFIGSLGSVFTVPFLLVELWLLARLRSGFDTFRTLFALALLQPIHSFVLIEMGSSPTTSELLIGILLLAVLLVSVALLLLWWRHVHDERERVEAESEFEL